MVVFPAGGVGGPTGTMSALMYGALDLGISDLYFLPDLPAALRLPAVRHNTGAQLSKGPPHMQLSAPASPEKAKGYSCGAMTARRANQPGLLSPGASASPASVFTPANTDTSAAATPQQLLPSPHSSVHRAQRDRKASVIALEAAEGIRGPLTLQKQSSKFPVFGAPVTSSHSSFRSRPGPISHKLPYKSYKPLGAAGWSAHHPRHPGHSGHPGARGPSSHKKIPVATPFEIQARPKVSHKKKVAPPPSALAALHAGGAAARGGGWGQGGLAATALPLAEVGEGEEGVGVEVVAKKKHRQRQWRGYNRRNRKIRAFVKKGSKGSCEEPGTVVEEEGEASGGEAEGQTSDEEAEGGVLPGGMEMEISTEVEETVGGTCSDMVVEVEAVAVAV